jgi:hypothetical protein
LFPYGWRHSGKCTHLAFSKVYTLLCKVSNTLRAFPKELPIPFRYCANGLQELLGTFPNMFPPRFGHFLNISHQSILFLFIMNKIEDNTEKLKTISRSSPNYDQSNHTTFSQTQTVAKIPLSNTHLIE